MSDFSRKDLLEACIKIADQAGQVIMDVYKSCDLETNYKEDNSPLTKADLESHNVIVKALATLSPDIPIISEEDKDIGRADFPVFWLVDPLDGTKEFINRNGEFTANIALIEEGVPVLGVVYAPARDIMYVGGKGVPARKRDETGAWQNIEVSANVDGKIRIVASRSHGSDLLDVWLKKRFKDDDIELCAAGSSLKLCLVADGSADYYPRFGRTMEWDIAAGQAVLLAAGGYVTVYDEDRATHLQPLTYGKEGLDNPHFIASGTPLKD